jgi:pimeloyl-ACP methyl ester carboxylesterase
LTLENGQQLFYQSIAGAADSPYLVFLHEGLGCTGRWKSFPKALCKKTRCPGLIYDRSGYGLSSAATQARSIHYLHRAALDELPKVLHTLIPERPYILVGHSDGGSIALIHGAERDARLCGLVTLAAHTYIEPETLAGITKAGEAHARGELELLTKYHGDKSEQVFHRWYDTWLAPWFKSWSIEYLLPAIRCPLLVIQGADDEYASDQQVHSIVSRATAKAEACLLSDCGHHPHVDQPALVLDKVAAFIQAVRSSSMGTEF